MQSTDCNGNAMSDDFALYDFTIAYFVNKRNLEAPIFPARCSQSFSTMLLIMC